ncbi:phenylalanine-tRNA ligase, beta subunit [Spizellomyces punctatus DAOM BR117]|uniref:phenylalanine--tRNA ligase n=1 Tax=Spizellomyces punctatus (strain DAOM BR117) TaxID=645134 RepID=A0A0L0H451_SPIPD|nr:phenylalanine-tRNA ligase, beta subunit [Spizellomyces punctatus DAOM BR117]KNC95982.1 phenylalanine-tRNA ligase, beta subunit [Spizellomyces punctatus DAOM BR117]|eukprot:XP_016604022.1 phenylalanine-tRNA ligase, beta subunit [Spizellomyces punctatus DAOM BR117]
MPTVNVDAERYVFKPLKKTFDAKEFEELCFEFGIELEEATSEREMAAKEGEKADDLSDKLVYKIDIPANRYDMLCGEGISRALKAYLQIEKPPVYKVVHPVNGKALEKLYVKPETGAIRPHVVAAILRDVTLDQGAYDSFIELQDKLHNNICRKRTLVAIGTHDLDTIQGPFSYEALPPKSLKFIPLNQSKAMDGEELMKFYETDRKLSKFLHIIRDAPRYPIIFDSKRTVLSLPPIINGDHSKIKLSTKNIFIECTATDLTKAKIVLNTVVTMFSQYCSKPFTVEPVEVVHADGTSVVYPDLSSRTVEADVNYINRSIGVNLEADKIAELLEKMSLSAQTSEDHKKVIVSVPPTRSDILHACDVMEDVAVAYGFNNIVETTPKFGTVAVQQPVNKLTDQLRREIALAGYTEVLPFTLCSHDENFAWLNKEDKGEAVKLSNPKTVEYEVVRTSLLPGMLKTINANQHYPRPFKIFEVSDVVFKDDRSEYERRSRNQRNLCAVYSNNASGFENIHGLLDRIMMKLDVKLVPHGDANGYYIKESENATFFPGRRADVYYQNEVIGSFGIVHPNVLEKYEISFPCTAIEINVEPFV